jgi:molybdopterin-binding protein
MNPGWIGDYIQSVINQKIICNELQAGLLNCQGNVLAPATRIVRCEDLSALVEEAIQSGQIAILGIDSLTFDGTHIWLVDQAGVTHDINLASIAPQSLTSSALNVSLTMRDGTVHVVDLTAAVTDAIAKKTLTNAVITKDSTLVLTLGDGSQVNVVLKSLLTDAQLVSGNVNSTGDIELVRGDGTTVTIDANALRKVKIDRDSPFTGNGDDVPLNMDFSRVCWKVIDSITMDDRGLHIKIDNQCDAVTLPMSVIQQALADKISVCVSPSGFITGNGQSGACLDLDLQKIMNALVANANVMNTLINNLNNKIAVSTNGTLSGNGTTASPLSVTLSSDEGNLLTLRPNGVYYGQQASADVSKLYVDSVAGDDKNSGTQAQPLKTLATAIYKVREDQSNTIYLRCGGEYLWPRFVVSNGATRTIQAYGDPYIDGNKVPQVTPERRSYTWWIRDAIVRPKIYAQVTYTKQIQVFSNMVASPQNGGVLECTGLQFICEGVNDPGTPDAPAGFDPKAWARWNTYMVYGNSSGKVNFYGCKFQGRYAPKAAKTQPNDVDEDWWGIVGKDSVGEGAQPKFTACSYINLVTTPGQKKYPNIINVYSGMAQLDIRPYSDNFSDLPGYEYLVQNMGNAVDITNVLTGIVADQNGVPRNLTANIVI